VPGESGNEGVFVNSIVSGGAIISGGGVNRSILFPGVWVQDDAIVEDAILLNDVVIGEGAQVRRYIIDKNVVVPAGEEIGVDRVADWQRFQMSDKGIVVIPKGYSFTRS
jgi:glucose-1-phosphate adenylyltransferase